LSGQYVNQALGPVNAVSGPIAVLGLMGGPALSLIAAIVCLLIARHRQGSYWPTAAFTNATIRLFPCAMDVLRAVQGIRPFSDEGNLGLALSPSSSARSFVVLCFFAVAALLTVLAARQYHFHKFTALKVLCIYLLSLAIGIVVVITDELLHSAAMQHMK
jgi:hypothetical protein